MLITPPPHRPSCRRWMRYESNRSAPGKPKVKVGRTSDKFDESTVEGSGDSYAGITVPSHDAGLALHGSGSGYDRGTRYRLPAMAGSRGLI